MEVEAKVTKELTCDEDPMFLPTTTSDTCDDMHAYLELRPFIIKKSQRWPQNQSIIML